MLMAVVAEEAKQPGARRFFGGLSSSCKQENKTKSRRRPPFRCCGHGHDMLQAVAQSRGVVAASAKDPGDDDTVFFGDERQCTGDVSVDRPDGEEALLDGKAYLGGAGQGWRDGSANVLSLVGGAGV